MWSTQQCLELHRLHTAPLRPFWSCSRLWYLSHCWLIWKHDTHGQLNPVYAVESLSTYRRWLRSTQLNQSELFVWPWNLYRKGKRSGRDPGSKEECFGDRWFVTVTKPVSSVLGPELRQLFGGLSFRPSSFTCSEWQVWFILSRPLFLPSAKWTEFKLMYSELKHPIILP